jgi:glycosyltransferase involved in cell wall biosynthesis
MKVLFLTNIPSPYRVDFFNLISKKINLTVIFERKFSSERNKNWHKTKNLNFRYYFLNSLYLFRDKSISFGAIFHLLKNKYDFIIIGGYSTPTATLTILFLKLLRIKFILNIDGGFIKHKENFFKYFFKNMLISSASYWLSPGKSFDSYLKHYGANASRIFYYPFSSVFRKDILKRKEINIRFNSNKSFTIIYVGMVKDSKGINEFIFNAMKNPLFNYIVVGGQPSLNIKALLIAKKISNIKFFDFMEKHDVFSILKESDIFLFLTKGDVWGLVINEALAAGLPIITTNKCGAGVELIKHGKNGFFVNIQSPTEIQKYILMLEKSPNLRREMSNNNIILAKKLTLELMASKTYAILSSIKFIKN